MSILKLIIIVQNYVKNVLASNFVILLELMIEKELEIRQIKIIKFLISILIKINILIQR